jgi:GNAT superfamily N-acetyltransferase
MTEPAVRKVLGADLAALSGLYRAWDDGGHDEPCEFDPLFEERFCAWYADESNHRLTWLAELDGRPVGFADLVTLVQRPASGRAATRWGYLDNAFVLEAYRNRGIGAALLDAVLDDAGRRGLSRIMLYPTPRSISFYRRAGFDLLPAETKTRMVRTVTAETCHEA